MNSQYDITKSNAFCTQCGSKQDRDAINNITLCKNSNFFKFTGNEFDQFIQRIKKTSGAKFRKESLDFECGQCGHINDFNANQFIKPITKEWKCRECDSCIARVKLLNGLSLLKDFNYISSNNYFIVTQQIKNFNNDQVFQFKIEIINPDCNHSRELAGSQICKLQDSNLGCPKCLKSGIVSSTIINSINYHLNQKSFTINNYKQIIDEIQSLDSYE
ncbi:hypothetical protein ACTFIZ_004124 [Dictyostelium cf. discoideum]